MTTRTNVAHVQVSEISLQQGQQLARQVFANRGNHSEVHLHEGELAALLAIAVELGSSEPLVQQGQA